VDEAIPRYSDTVPAPQQWDDEVTTKWLWQLCRDASLERVTEFLIRGPSAEAMGEGMGRIVLGYNSGFRCAAA
jgi:hypothetical protein